MSICTTIPRRLRGTELRSTANVGALSGIYGGRMVRHLVLRGGHGGLRTTLDAVVGVARRAAGSTWLIHGRQAGLRGIGRRGACGGGGTVGRSEGHGGGGG